jgi:sulfite exporter TauE/SafE
MTASAAAGMRASIAHEQDQALRDLAFNAFGHSWHTSGFQSVETSTRHAAEALEGGSPEVAEKLLNRAKLTHAQQLEGQRKVVYFLGVVVGIIGCGLIQWFLESVNSFGGDLPQGRPSQLILFAGMGTLASVLTRLNRFEMKRYATRTLVLISGASRPLVSIFTAFGVYAVLTSGLIGVTVNGHSIDQLSDQAYWAVAFLCGFSERFGQRVLSNAGDTIAGAAGSHPSTAEPENH